MGVGIGVVIEAVVLVVALGRDEAIEQARRSATPPGSNSIVVIAAVDPRTKAVTSPSPRVLSATTRWTSAVMSMTSESPCVE